MKKVIKYSFLLILLLVAIYAYQNYPISSEAKDFPIVSDTANIRKNLVSIISAGYRNHQNVTVLDTVAEKIRMVIKP